MYARIIPNKQLQPIDLVAPGFKGLNLSQSAGVLPPSFATEAQNAVLDPEGRLRARFGFTSVTSDTIDSGATIKTLFEYIDSSGVGVPIVAWDGGIADDIGDPESNDISGSVTDADGTWKFVNFNSKVVGFQNGLIPIVYTGTGSFAEIAESSGTAPSSGIGTAAYGRIWAVDSDLQTIQYSGLLDEADWGGAGAGAIDMRTVWPDGMDVVTAIESFNGFLIVFGKRSIVIWASGITGALGLDPTELFVQDTITGIGCLSQFTVQKVGRTDLLFLSHEGIMSLKRLIVQKSAPLADLSKYVRDAIVQNAQSQNMNLIRSTYNPLTGFYALSMPTIGVTWVLDQRRRWSDDEGSEVSIVTRWSVAPTALHTRLNNVLLASIGGGAVHQYSGNTDDGTQFRFIYKSPWLDLGEELANRLKILKRLGAILFVSNDTQVVFKWSADFREDVFNTTTVAAGTSGTVAEWGVAEYGIGEYGGGLALRILKVPAKGTAQYFRLGIEAEISGDFSLQQAELFTKIGRLA